MKKIFLILPGCLLFIIGSLLLLWFNLEWLLNSKNIQRIADYTHTELRWEILNINIENIGLLAKDIHFQTKNLCLVRLEPSIEFCVERSDINIEATLLRSSPFFQITKFDLRTVFSHFELRIPPSEKDEKKPFKWPKIEFTSLDSLLASYLEKLPLETIKIFDVQLKNIKIFLPNRELTSSILSVKKNSDISIETNFQILNQEKKILKGSILGNLNLKSPLTLLATGSFNIPSLNFSTSLSLSWTNILSIKLNSRIKKTDLEVRSHASIDLTKDHWSASPYAEIFYAKLPFKRVLINDCPLHLSFKHDKPELIKNECHVILNNITKQTLPRFPKSLYFKTELYIPLDLQSSNLTAKPTINVNLQRSSLLTFNLQASILSIFNLTDKKILKFSIDTLQSEIKMSKFEDLVSFLKTTTWAVPAPLNILKGQIRLSLSGIPTDIQSKHFSAKAQLKTDLRSNSQKLETESNFTINLFLKKFRIGLSGTISLKDVKLQLPTISLRDPPSLMPDPRFKKMENKTEKRSSLSEIFEINDLVIRTERKPILIQANLVPNLLPDPIPVRLDYNLKSSYLKTTGKISIDEMNLEIFRRKAVVEKLNLLKNANSKVQDINGEIIYRTSEVLVRILIMGPIDKPNIEFVSEPPLSRQQIISILIFNKSLQELTDEELSSTGHLNQALLSNAFGLVSLFLLSSTPIESLYFDPRTSSYTARIRIDKSNSISVVSDLTSSRQFIWRRRLGGPWSISTTVESSDSEDSITTLIEWFKRF